MTALTHRIRRSVDAQTVYGLATLAVCATAAILRLAWLLSSPVAFGRDGYFYALQLDSFRHGELAIPSAALVPLALLVALRSAAGDDVLAIKLLSVASSFALTLGTAAFARAITARAEAAFLAAVATAAASLHNLFLVEFLNNAVGLTLFIWFVVLAVWTRDGSAPASPWLRAACAGCALAAVFSHASAGVAVMIVLMGSLLVACAQRCLAKSELVLAGLVAAALIALLITGHLLRMTAATAALPSLNLWNHMSGSYSVLVWATVVFGGLTIATRRQRGEAWEPWGSATGVVIGMLMVGVVFAANPYFLYDYSPQNIVDRLGLWGWVICCAVVPVIAFESRQLTPFVLVRGVVLIFGLLLAGTTRGIPLGADPRFLASRTQLLNALTSLPPNTLHGTTVIAGHGDQFVVSYVTGADARSKKPARNPGAVLWLVKSWKKDSRWPDRATRLGPYGLIADGDLESWLENMSRAERREVAAANPHHLGWDVIRLAVRNTPQATAAPHGTTPPEK